METRSSEKQVMIVGIDDSEQSTYALEWILDRFFAPFGSDPPFKLVLVHAKLHASTSFGIAGPGTLDVMPHVDKELRKIAARVDEQAQEICAQRSVSDAVIEEVEGDPRNVLCDAVEKYQASILVVGSHGYGAIKRALLGSVSDYCAHHAHCSVMIVKTPKTKLKASSMST